MSEQVLSWAKMKSRLIEQIKQFYTSRLLVDDQESCSEGSLNETSVRLDKKWRSHFDGANDILAEQQGAWD